MLLSKANIVGVIAACTIAAGSCGADTELRNPGGETEVAAVSSALLLDPNASTTYVYFRSNSTGWGADTASLMTRGAGGVWTKTFTVSEAWMVSNAAPMIFTLTNQQNGWGSRSTFLTDRGHQQNRQPPQTVACQPAPLAELNQNFTVKFPALGQYTVSFHATSVSYTFSAAGVTCPDPGCAARLGAGQSCVIDDFSAGAGRWSSQENQAGGSAFRVPPGEIEIENLIGNDALWSLPVNVLPGAAYTMTGRQRGEDITGIRVETGAPANRGASMGVLDPESFAYLEKYPSGADAACPPPPAPEPGACNGLNGFPWSEVRLTFLAEPSALTRVAARLGGPTDAMNFVTGRAFFDDISFRRLGSVLSDQQHVQLFYETADLTLPTDAGLKTWMNRLDVIYRVYTELAGGVPFGGATQDILSAAHSIVDAVARAGNPITYQRHFLRETLARVQSQVDYDFAALHELGHNFLLTDRFVWDGEEWANMMIFLALDRLDSPNPHQAPGLFRFNWPDLGYFTRAPDLRDAVGRVRIPGLVGGADITYRLMAIATDVGVFTFGDTFRYFTGITEAQYQAALAGFRAQDSDHDGQPDSVGVAQFYYFLDRLSVAARVRLGRPGYSALALFTPGELAYIHDRYR